MDSKLQTHTSNVLVYVIGSLIWLLGGLFFLYEFFLRASMVSLVPFVQSTLGVDATQVGTISTGYYIAYAFMQIPVGILVDRLGVRMVLTGGVFLCALGCFLFSEADTVLTAFLGRFAMGLGSSAGFVCLLTLSLNWFPRKYFGLLSGCTQILGTIGPLIAGVPLTHALTSTHGDWQWIMEVVGMIGLGFTVVVALFVRNAPKQPVNTRPQLSQPVAKVKLKDAFKLLAGIPQVWYVIVFAFFVYAAVPVMGALWGKSYLQANGLSEYQAGTAVSFIWLGLGIASPVLGLLSDMLRRRKPVLVFYGVTGVFTVLLLTFGPVFSVTGYSVLFFLIGVAASGQTLSFVVMAENVPRRVEGTAMGCTNMAVMLGGSVGQYLLGWLLDHVTSKSQMVGDNYPAWAFHEAASFLILFFVMASLVSLFFIKETRGQKQIELSKFSLQKA